MMRRTILAGVLASALGCAGAGSVQTGDAEPGVSGDQIERLQTVRVQDLVISRVPGIRVSQTAEGYLMVRARGVASLTGEDQLLFVVDGIPVSPNADGTLPGVSITEIESISVLKELADTSPYGMRGSNGVILVKTKTGAGKR